MNLLAAVALGFLLLDPDQLFDASFQLTFLAVGFLGAFAAPAIAATSGPLAAGLRDLADTGRDLHLQPRAAQFRIEMRLLAETLRAPLWVVAWPARLVLLVYEIVLTSAVVQLGLALPMVVYFHRLGFSGLSANAFVVPLMGAVVPVGFLAVFTGWQWIAKIAGLLLVALAKGGLVPRQPGAELADSDAAGVARRRAGGGADCGGRSGGRVGALLPVAVLLGAAVVAPVRAGSPSRRTGIDGDRRGPGRQSAGGVSRWQAHAGGRRRHSRVRADCAVAARYRRGRGGALPVGSRLPHGGRGGALPRARGSQRRPRGADRRLPSARSVDRGHAGWSGVAGGSRQGGRGGREDCAAARAGAVCLRRRGDRGAGADGGLRAGRRAEEQRLAGDARDVRAAQPVADRRRGAGNRTGDGSMATSCAPRTCSRWRIMAAAPAARKSS